MSYLIFGFFLGKETVDDETDLYRFACASTDTSQPRQVLKLRSIHRILNVKIGEVLFIDPGNKNLAENTLCSFVKLSMPPFIHHDVMGGMVHTEQKVDIRDNNCTQNGIFKHRELGEMIDEKFQCVSGFFGAITFRIIPTDTTFTIEVLQALKCEWTPEEVPKTNEFDMIGTIYQIEKDTIQMRENQSWEAFGRLELLNFNYKSVFAGPRPVLQLVDKSFKKLFAKIVKNSAKIQLIKLKMNEKGEWEDVPQEEYIELKGITLSVVGHDDKCLVKIVGAHERIIQAEMQIGESYRLEKSSSLRDDIVEFWTSNKYEESKLFQHTNEGEKNFDLLAVLDSHATKINEKIKDKYPSIRKMNDVQQRAYKMALNEKRKLVCIQGPPGTGKSFVLAYVLATLVEEGKSAVVLTPTREALFNLKEITKNILKTFDGLEVHRDALMDAWTFEERMETSEIAKSQIETLKPYQKSWEEKKLTDEEFMDMRSKVLRKTRFDVMMEIVPNVKIVFATISSAFTQLMMKSKMFNPEVCVIDEAGQVMEAQQWPACFAMHRIVMAGDPHQLPAVVFSEVAKQHELQKSVMDRIMERKEEFSCITLETQYRCHPEIIGWSNKTFYGNKLKHAVGPEYLYNFLNKSLSSAMKPIYGPLIMFDTSMITESSERVRYYERNVFSKNNIDQKKTNRTYENLGEAEIVLNHLKCIVRMGIDQTKIALITPYRGQLELLEKMVHEQELKNVHIGTVDSYQGQEFDVVIFSMVRSNPARHLGFVTDLRRMNVAITRAKYHFCLVGNGYMLNSDHQEYKQLNALLFYFIDRKLKYPPTFAKQKFRHFNSTRIPKCNNFGRDFEDFKKATNDQEMLKLIERWENGFGMKRLNREQ